MTRLEENNEVIEMLGELADEVTVSKYATKDDSYRLGLTIYNDKNQPIFYSDSFLRMKKHKNYIRIRETNGFYIDIATNRFKRMEVEKL